MGDAEEDAGAGPARSKAPGRPGPGPIRAMRRALAGPGYDPGPADGPMGAGTRAAVRARQAAVGPTADGRPAPEPGVARRSIAG